jgi:protein-histidine pros-kinase
VDPDTGEELHDTLEIERASVDDLLASLLERSTDGISLTDRTSGRLLSVSSAFCRLTGYARDELVGRTPVEIGLVSDYEEPRAAMLGALDQNQGGIYELPVRRKDGSLRRFEFSVQLVHGGEVLSVITRDVTESKDAERELKLRADLLNLAHDAVVVCEPADKRVTFWNREAETVYGYSAEEAEGQVIYELLDSEYPDSVDAVGDALLQAGQWEGVLRQTRKDGQVIAVSSRQALQCDERGRPTAIIELNSDITERIRAEDNFRGLLDSAPDAMVIVNGQGEIQFGNTQTSELFGYQRDELLGQPVEMLVPVRYRGHHPQDRGDFFAAPRSRPMGDGRELWGRRKDGSEFAIEISLSPLETADGLMATAAIRDVTERKLFEQTLRDTNVQLERADRAKNIFFSSMSHELRTPLNAILGFTGTMLMGLHGPLTDEQIAPLRTVQRTGKHLLSLINDLLDLARIESQQFELHPEPIDCRVLLEEVVGGLQPLADAKGLALEVSPVPEATELVCDRRSVTQILINLTNNAIKFTDQGSVRLDLSQRSEGAQLVTRFAVMDTGCGIAPEDQVRLFEAFERITTGSTQSFESTGLGLYISQMLAGLIGAEITLASVPGEGSTFGLELTGSPE